MIALNKTLDELTAEEICGIFTEVVIAPDATAEALQVFAKKEKSTAFNDRWVKKPKRCGQKYSPSFGWVFSARYR